MRHWCAPEESHFHPGHFCCKTGAGISGLSPADIGCCICATLGPGRRPQLACRVQAALALRETGPLGVNRPVPVAYAAAPARATTLASTPRPLAQALSRLRTPPTPSTAFCLGDGWAAVFQLALTLSPLPPVGGTGSRGHPGRRALRNCSAPITMDWVGALRLSGGSARCRTSAGAKRAVPGGGGLGGLPPTAASSTTVSGH